MIDRLSLRLLLAQGADVLTFVAFYLLVGVSVHEERNPIILALMALGGLQAVALFKTGVTLLVIRRRRNQPPVKPWFARASVIAISAATASGIVGAGFNLAAILTS